MAAGARELATGSSPDPVIPPTASVINAALGPVPRRVNRPKSGARRDLALILAGNCQVEIVT